MNAKLWRQFDPILFAICFLLVLYGTVLIYAASVTPSDNTAALTTLGRQASFAVIGLGVLIVAAITDYRIYQTFFWPLLVTNLGLLVFVLVKGQISFGAQRWISIGFFEVQPSELGKLLVILTLAKYIADHEEGMRKLRYLVGSMPLAFVPALLVYPQPDLGTSIVYVAVWLGMVVASGARWRHLAGLGVLAAASLPVAARFIHGYMWQRLAIFLNPEADASGAGYNIIQARISIGSGGWLGQGYAHGTQTQLSFLRVQHTDFIFSVLAEELGFVGCLLLFSLFILLFLRGLRVANYARDGFGRAVVVGIVWMLLFQTFVNVGMNMQLMPVTGIPLPFISYGRSSLLTGMMSIGILESILMRHRRITF